MCLVVVESSNNLEYVSGISKASEKGHITEKRVVFITTKGGEERGYEPSSVVQWQRQISEL